METIEIPDPIWEIPASAYKISADETVYSSSRTGKFRTNPVGLRDYISNWNLTDRAKITTWILDHNLVGEDAKIDVPAIKSIKSRRNLSMSEKIDRFLLMLDASSYRPGDPLPWRFGTETPETVRVRHMTMMWIEAATDSEFYAFQFVLDDAGVIKIAANGISRLAGRGYERLEQLRTGGADTNQAFVAMWFSPTMDDVFNQGFEPALARAGYRAQRIDRKEHNNKIDDEIIAEIKRSRFVVADFTCGTAQTSEGNIGICRGGVYYEAGFAQGMNIPVIWTVREDQINLVHFDTRQYNHITWSSAQDLEVKLYNRVCAAIGQRP